MPSRASSRRSEPLEASPRIGFLELLEPRDRADLIALGQLRRFGRGDVLMRQGEATDSVVVVLEGQVKVTVDTADGRSVVYAVYGPGDVLGEFEAIGDYSTREASVVALDEVASRVITRDAYITYLLGHPAAALALVRILTRRLGVADRRRAGSTSTDAAHALAEYLVELAAGDDKGQSAGSTVKVPLAQQDLASLIGVSRNSLIRALASLRSMGLIATDGRSIRIVDAAALRGYADEHASEDGAG